MSKSAADPILAITPGEPAGIGPDLVLALDPTEFPASLVVIADHKLLQDRAKLLGIAANINLIASTNEAQSNLLNVLEIPTRVDVVPGELNKNNGSYVLETLETAVSLCESDVCHGMVTGPVNKAVINDSGIPFSGHTEWLAERTNTPRVVMMLASGSLKVALATTHLPLRQVADALDAEDLFTTLQIIHEDFVHKLQIPKPRIMVCGLNPHAGESGHLGTEEQTIIEPVIRRAQDAGIHAFGPIPADTAFTQQSLATADIVLAMYHDQGLPVLKHQGFGDAVNVTLGLPIVRTSVDHGTALDLVGTGKADPGSLITAIRYALSIP